MYTLAQQDVDWNDRDIRIIDAYAIANFSEHLNLKVGLTKIPLTRAGLDDCFAPLSQDRSMFVYSAYGTSPAKFSRDLGAVATGRFFDDRVTYFAGIFQGREGTTQTAVPYSPNSLLMGATALTSTAPKTNLEYVGRVTYDFLDSEGGSGYQGTYFGEKKVMNIGVGMAYQPQAAWKSSSNMYWLANGTVTNVAPTSTTGYSVTKITSMADTSQGTVDYRAIAVDGMFEYPTSYGVTTLTAQYLNVDFDDAYKTTSSGDKLAVVAGMNGQKHGYYTKAAQILPFKVGNAGKLQPYALYENWRFAHLLGVDQVQIQQTGGGINYYITGDQRVRLTAEYLKTDFDKAMAFVVPGASSTGASGYVPNVRSFDTFRMMLQVVF